MQFPVISPAKRQTLVRSSNSGEPDVRFAPEADMRSAEANVRYGPIADITGDQYNDANLCRLYRRCVGTC
jgi:hypothetical protein